ncbi:hypothetical protein CRENBAI_011369 [Crenichthys baileyi]|uniref:Uncharacterized protein n=1 Tax=Crenichthys baileyi TaxID=28760 RepID=A0AAV9RAY3_9TELE
MPITEAEVRNAVTGMKTGKSPSINGFIAVYYHKFMDIIAPVLTEVYQEAGCTVVQLVALLPCNEKVLGSTSGQGSLYMEFACTVHAWVLTGYSGFLPQSKDMT